MRLAMELAIKEGVREFVAQVQSTNEAMLALLARIAPRATRTWDGNLQHVRIPLVEGGIQPSKSP